MSDAVRYSVEADSAVSYSDPGMVIRDSKEIIEALDDVGAMMAVANSVLACEAVTYFSEATTESVSEAEKGVAVSDSVIVVIVGLDMSVKSEDGQIS